MKQGNKLGAIRNEKKYLRALNPAQEKIIFWKILAWKLSGRDQVLTGP